MTKMIFVAAVLTLAACSPEEMSRSESSTNGSSTNGSSTNGSSTNGSNTNGSSPNGSSTGEDLYVKYCQVCHGPEGTGGAVWAGTIQGIDPIHDIVRDGRGQMAPVAATDSEIVEIQDYLNSFGVDLSTLSGEEIFASQCASCHGPTGEGTATGPIIQFAVPGYAKWVTRNGRQGLGFPGPMTAYGVDRVTDTQLDEIIDFLHAQPRPTTGEKLYVTFCANCHGVNGRGGNVGEGVVRQSINGDVREGKGGTNYGARHNYMPGWSQAELSVEEVSLIQAYVNAL